jgi:hypothetical protein
MYYIVVFTVVQEGKEYGVVCRVTRLARNRSVKLNFR